MPLKFKPGDRFPDVTLADEKGQPTSISALADGRPLFLVLFRGPW